MTRTVRIPGPDHPITIDRNLKRVVVSIGGTIVADTRKALILREAGYPPVRLESLGGSRVLEIDPITKQIIWQYSARSSQIAEWRFYSPFAGSAQRLPNGNTLIDEGAQGRAIQVTAEGEIVWEYISPFLLPAPTAPIAGRPSVKTNLLYRTQAVPYSWVPDGTPHTEEAVVPAAWGTFHVP